MQAFSNREGLTGLAGESKTVGQRVAALREFYRMTQEELAEAVGVHSVTVSKWERGTQEVSGRYLPKLAEALGIPVNQLMGLTENVSRENPEHQPPADATRALERFDISAAKVRDDLTPGLRFAAQRLMDLASELMSLTKASGGETEAERKARLLRYYEFFSTVVPNPAPPVPNDSEDTEPQGGGGPVEPPGPDQRRA